MNNNIGKQALLVVVWEWKNKQGRWRPYIPEVTQHLERAFVKKLKSVMLGDADPKLKEFCVNLSSLQQTCTTGNIGLSTNVRRTLYPQNSPAGQGAVWQWAGDKMGDWHSYDMCVQCVLEEAWSTGVQTIDMNESFPQCPYVINFCTLIQTNKKTKGVRSIRRKTQAAYPIGRPATPHPNSVQSATQGPSISGINTKPPTVCQDQFSEASKGKRRGSKEEIDIRAKSEGGARSLLNKVGDLLHFSGSGNSNDGTSVSKSAHNPDMLGPGRVTKSQLHNGSSNANAQTNSSTSSKPKPSESHARKPPVPKPRTLFPLAEMQHSHYHHPAERMHGTRSSTLNHRGMDTNEDQFGSNITLNSDSSTLSTRRPSIETISTYLSQDSFNEDYGALSMSTDHHSNFNGIKTTNLINLSDSMSDDEEVFSADEEVREVLMNSDHDKQAPFPKIAPYDPSIQSASHFVPINAPDVGKSNSPNGVKRKRTSDKATNGASFSPPQIKNNNNMSYLRRNAVNEREQLLVKHVNSVYSSSNDDCSICMCSLNEESSYDQTSKGFLVAPIVALSICKHPFHEECLGQLISSSSSSSNQFIQCPNCKTLHGMKTGTQPPGQMRIQKIRKSLPGYTNCDTIEISYMIPRGIQGPEHPRPNRPYYPFGFPRVAYLPDNQKGQKVLRLLQEAWNRRLIFTIGTSVTNGMDDAVTWNEIHHKTEFYDRSGHGYPDPAYLDNVLMELSSHGVTE